MSDELTLRLILVTPWLLILCISDVRYRRLPNKLTLGGAAVFSVYALGFGGLELFGDSLSAGLLSGLFLIIPFCLKAAGGGDVKMLFACGIFLGLANVMTFLFFVSIAGFILAIVMWVVGKADIRRIKHYFRVVFDFNYDRKSGKADLPSVNSEACRVPFGVAIAVGVWCCLAWNIMELSL